MTWTRSDIPFAISRPHPRVSQARQWITDVLEGRVSPKQLSYHKIHDYNAKKLPTTAAARAAETLLDAWNRDKSTAQMPEFEKEHRSAAALARRPIQGGWKRGPDYTQIGASCSPCVTRCTTTVIFPLKSDHKKRAAWLSGFSWMRTMRLASLA